MQEAEALNGVRFQRRAWNWVIECFGRDLANDRAERNRRFLEETVELVQSLGCDKTTILQIVEYVYARDTGIPEQEVGGVMVTLQRYARQTTSRWLLPGETNSRAYRQSR